MAFITTYCILEGEGEFFNFMNQLIFRLSLNKSTAFVFPLTIDSATGSRLRCTGSGTTS